MHCQAGFILRILPTAGARARPAHSAFRWNPREPCAQKVSQLQDMTVSGRRGAESLLTLRRRCDPALSKEEKTHPSPERPCPKPSGGTFSAAGCGEGFKLRPHFPLGHPQTPVPRSPLPSSPQNPKLKTTPKPHPADCLRQSLKHSTLSPRLRVPRHPLPSWLTGWCARAAGAAARRCVSAA